jgi:hypothetical protein
VEDVTSHLMPHLSLHPTLRTCSSDTILRGISELATANTAYVSDTGKSYDFNTAPKLNSLLVKVLKNTGQLVAGESYDLDFDHQFIETEKYDAKVRFHQQDTLERIFSNLESNDIHVKRARMDCGSLYDSLLALRGWKRKKTSRIKAFVFRFFASKAA